MDDAWLGLGVVVVLLLVVAVAVVADLRRRPGGTSTPGPVSLRRSRELDARHQSPGPPVGGTFL